MILILLSNCYPRHSSAVVSFNQCFSFWIGKLQNLKKRINTAIICPVYYLLSLSPFACKTTTMHTTAQTFSSNIFKHFWKGLLHNQDPQSTHMSFCRFYDQSPPQQLQLKPQHLHTIPETQRYLHLECINVLIQSQNTKVVITCDR